MNDRWTARRWVYNSLPSGAKKECLTYDERKQLNDLNNQVRVCKKRLIGISMRRRSNIELYEHHKMLLNYAEKRREGLQ
jgi:hypothetical protein